MSGHSPGLILLVVALVVVAAVLTTVEAALSSFSRARALEQITALGCCSSRLAVSRAAERVSSPLGSVRS